MSAPPICVILYKILKFAPRVMMSAGGENHHFRHTDGVGRDRTRGREIQPLSGDRFDRRRLRAPCTLGVDQVCVGGDKQNGVPMTPLYSCLL